MTIKMQIRRISVALLLVLVAVFCLGLAPTLVFADTADSYYDKITATQGNELLGQLHDLITTTHTKYTSYDGDCKNSSTISRTDPGSTSGKVREFYSNADINASWGSGKVGTWNREHVWCQSLSNGMWGESGGGADLHHIRPVESGLNSTRGNIRFGDSGNYSEAKYYKDTERHNVALGGYIGNSSFEPIDEVKGDVARILFYVYTHYNTYSNVYGTTNGNGRESYFGTLRFTMVVNQKTEQDAISMLLDWNKNDPVDDVEQKRNDVVFGIQGNRNPFIDHPEYADAIWDSQAQTVKPMKLEQTSLVLAVGESQKLEINREPTQLNWTSNNSSVAQVAYGNVMANGAGTAVITVSDGQTTLTCTVTVVGGWSINDFMISVNTITSSATAEEKFNAIKVSLLIYNKLNESEKAQVSAQYETLQKAISEYNSNVDKVNTGATNATTTSVYSVSQYFPALRILINVLKELVD